MRSPGEFLAPEVPGSFSPAFMKVTVIANLMASVISFRTTLPKSYWAAAQDVLQRPPTWVLRPMWGLCFAPDGQVCWAGQTVVHCLDKELYLLWLCLPEDDWFPACSGPQLPQAGLLAMEPRTHFVGKGDGGV